MLQKLFSQIVRAEKSIKLIQGVTSQKQESGIYPNN